MPMWAWLQALARKKRDAAMQDGKGKTGRNGGHGSGGGGDVSF